MPITVPCPSCNAKLKAPEGLVGKTVKCPGCGTPILIKAPAAAAAVKKPAPVEDSFEDLDDAPPPRKPAKSKPKVEEIDEIDDFTDEPPRKGKAKAKVADDVEDFTDEPPRKSKAIAKGKVEDDLEDLDEDEDDRPKKKGKGQVVPSGPTEDSERTMAMLLYLSGFVVGAIGPIVIWMMKRKESKFVDYHGKQWLNACITFFLITVLLGVIFGGLGGGLMVAEMYWIGWGIALFGGFIAFVLNAVATIFLLLAAFKAKGGQWYKMPMVKQFIK